LEVNFFLKALEKGADGVLVAGCLEGGCHFVDGNLFAKRRVDYIRSLMVEIGMEADRLRMVNVSASMARPLSEHIVNMVETISRLGPSPLRRGSELTQAEKST
jgi:coenzyme F420-reducing hydrogenase delta subunit